MLIFGDQDAPSRNLTDDATTVILLAFGISILYLVGSLWKVARLYPADQQERDGDSTPHIGPLQTASLPLSQALLILFGILLVVLGGCSSQ